MLFGLTDYLPEAVLTVGDNLEFLIRILVVELFGFLIGLERSKRQKDAGIRTHCIIAVTSAVIMILSKYCFVDLVDLGIAERNSDPGRMATQVVSGISFLGAGVIFRDRNSSSIKGLTTAAGMWATSAIVSPWATTPLWRRSSADTPEMQKYIRQFVKSHGGHIECSDAVREGNVLELELTVRCRQPIIQDEGLDLIARNPGILRISI